MSYDIFLASPPPAADPLAFARTAFEGQAPSEVPAPGWRERMRAVAGALAAAEPALRPEAFGDGPDDTRIELANDDSGLQILVFADSAFLHMAFWHTGAEARAAWEQAWRCLARMERETGGRAYDPQRDRLLDLGTDLDAVVEEYERRAADFLRTIPAPSPPTPPARPWWKFWG